MYYWVEFYYPEDFHHPEEDYNRGLDFNADSYALSVAELMVEKVAKDFGLQIKHAFSPEDPSFGEPFSRFFYTDLSAAQLKGLLNSNLINGVAVNYIKQADGNDNNYPCHQDGFQTLKEYFEAK